MAFHLREGFYFERNAATGDVVITVRGSARPDARPLRTLTVPENEWASVVASVSAAGGTGTAWQLARDLHSGALCE